MASNEQEINTPTERAMIPVSLDTQRRIMELVGVITSKRGRRTSQEYVINVAINRLDPESLVLDGADVR